MILPFNHGLTAAALVFKGIEAVWPGSGMVRFCSSTNCLNNTVGVCNPYLATFKLTPILVPWVNYRFKLGLIVNVLTCRKNWQTNWSCNGVWGVVLNKTTRSWCSRFSIVFRSLGCSKQLAPHRSRLVRFVNSPHPTSANGYSHLLSALCRPAECEQTAT